MGHTYSVVPKSKWFYLISIIKNNSLWEIRKNNEWPGMNIYGKCHYSFSVYKLVLDILFPQKGDTRGDELIRLGSLLLTWFNFNPGIDK